MNINRSTLAICLLAAIGNCASSTASAQKQSINISTSGDYVCVQRGPHSRIWQCAVLHTNQSGAVTTNLHSYTELATGLCHLQNGQYVDSVEEIDAVAGGAQAIQGRHQVHWTANGNTPGGAVTLTTPDGKTLLSTVFGLALCDMATGSNVVFSQLQDCTATISSNTLTYGNAFSNLNADVRYTYRKAGLSQDIILKQRPPTPEEYGLDPATSVLQLITEFFGPPEPGITAVTTNGLSDMQELSFGDMKMGVGHAFLFQSDARIVGGGPVAKSWTNISGRTFLIEEVPYKSISNLLGSLHASMIKPDKSKVRRTVSLNPPKSRKVSSIQPAQPVKQTKVMPKETSLVLDYDLLSSETNYTFQGDTTYLISDLCNLSGTNYLEGGTVIKYTNTSAAEIEVTNLVCETAGYRPAVFTSMNDDSVGTQIPGSTGDPSTNYAGSAALSFPNHSATLQNVRFNHLAIAIDLQPDVGGTIAGLNLADFQILNCQYAFNAYAKGYNLYNGLVYNIQSSVFEGGSGGGYQSLLGENLTIHNCADFDPSITILATFENCLMVQATNLVSELGSVPSVLLPNPAIDGTTVILDTDAGVFQTVGAASHYLADGSTNRNAGTTGIDPGLLADLATKTTYPPVTNFYGWFTNNYTFFPQAQRDNSDSTVDIGYHYDPLDYALSIQVSNATATVLPGTVLATMGTNYGIYLSSSGTFNCSGKATSPIYIVRYNTVQEQANTNWETTSAVWSGSLITESADSASLGSFFFTEWSALEQDGQVNAGNPNLLPLGFQDCQFYNGTIYGAGQTLLCTNCLFQRINMTLNSYNSPDLLSNTFCNNLFWQGALTFRHKAFDTNTWTFRDNLFDHTLIGLDHTYAGDIFTNNAYITNWYTLVVSGGDVILTNSPDYETGDLGVYYYPATETQLIHTGSRSAPAAGLYHYTVLTNNTIEGTNIVSIGFHYVACGTNGLPIDTNGDGIPDYLEDKNGNGLVDSGEIAWNVAGDLGLTVWITQPANNSKIP